MADDNGDDTSQRGRQSRWKEIADGASPLLPILLLLVLIAIMVIIYAVAV